jgi:hypothetical protein
MLDRPPPKPPFDTTRAAVLLLAAIILCYVAMSMVVVVRCTVFWIEPCANRNWGTIISEWFSEAIVVLIALVMANRPNPPPNE